MERVKIAAGALCIIAVAALGVAIRDLVLLGQIAVFSPPLITEIPHLGRA
jgi:hypothetical protein